MKGNKMRRISKKSVEKYGCRYCANVEPQEEVQGRKVRNCPHRKCPYTELKKYNSYEEYMEDCEWKTIDDIIKYARL